MHLIISDIYTLLKKIYIVAIPNRNPNQIVCEYLAFKKIISRMFVNISVIIVMDNTSGVMASWLVGIIVANLPVNININAPKMMGLRKVVIIHLMSNRLFIESSPRLFVACFRRMFPIEPARETKIMITYVSALLIRFISKIYWRDCFHPCVFRSNFKYLKIVSNSLILLPPSFRP